MELRNEKCSMFLIERGKKKVSNGFDLPDGKTIKALKMIKFSSTWECHMQKKMVEYLKKETKKRILQAIDKSNGDKGDWWKFKHSFEQLGEGCYKILWYLLIGQN